MHPSAYTFAVTAVTAADVEGKRVIEAGSMNVNGSVRGYVMALGPRSYWGIDIRPGAGVDAVCDAADLGPRQADVLICTEMLEHAADWRAAMRGMIGALRPGGLLVLTTRSAGFPVHGYPDDHWRFSVDAMGVIIAAAGLDIEQLEADQPSDPGVFVKARKPPGWAWPPGTAAAWDAAEVTRP